MDTISRFNTPRVLTLPEIRHTAPSVFAETPYEGMSDRYSFIPTIEVLSNLMAKGWLPVKAQEQKTRIDEKRGFTKHMIRLRQSDAPVMVGEVIPELVIVNAHDGGASYQLLAGLFRLACSNGLMVDEGTMGRISIRHSGDVVGEVAYAAKHMAKDVPKLARHVQEMRAIELTRDQQAAFAAAALDLRYDRDEIGRSLSPVPPERITAPRRHADTGTDLWTTFNLIQENLLRGGLRGRSHGETHRRVKTREVKSVSEDIRLNRALWTLAREMGQIVKSPRRKSS